MISFSKPKLNLRSLLALLILLAAGALLVTLWRNLPGGDPEELLEALPRQVDLALEQVHYTQNEDGRRRWTLDADSAAYQRDDGQASLENVRLTFFQAGRFDEVTLTANQGTLNQSSRQIEVWDQVVIATSRGERFYTERLHYDDSLRRVSSEETVSMVSPRLELTGKGFRLDLDSGRMQVLADVRALLSGLDGKTDE